MPTVPFRRTLDVAASRERCWQTLTDVPTLVRWVSVLEDAREIAPLERYTAVLADRLGMFKLRAELEIRVADVEEPEQISVSARGEDRQVASRISVDATLRLVDAGEGAQILVEGTYEVAGRVATMGSSTIRKKADKILDEFFSRASSELR